MITQEDIDAFQRFNEETMDMSEYQDVASDTE
jgi:hypothetical protein